MTWYIKADDLNKNQLGKLIVVDDYEGVTTAGLLWGIDLRRHPNRIVLHLAETVGRGSNREVFVNHDAVVAVD